MTTAYTPKQFQPANATELQAILDAEVDVVLAPLTYNVGSTSIVIPSTCKRFVLPPGGSIIYSGSSIAVLVDSHNAGNGPGSVIDFSGSVRRSALEWEGATPADTTSVGIRFKNCVRTVTKIRGLNNFRVGLQLLGDAATSKSIEVYSPYIFNNKTNVAGVQINSGASTEQQLFGGQLGYTSVVTDFTGTLNIDLSEDVGVSGWKFWGTNLEGNDVATCVECDGQYHAWYSCRWEAVGANKVHFGTNSNNNLIQYGLPTIVGWSAVNDEGANNVVNSFAA